MKMQVNQAQLIVTGDLAPDWITKWSDTVKPIMIRGAPVQGAVRQVRKKHNRLFYYLLLAGNLA